MAEKISGIYRIVCVKNGRYYYGSTKNVNRRWNAHKQQLRKGAHSNPIIQRSWNKHGEESFRIELIEMVTDGKLLEAEQIYLDKYVGKSNCMNVAKNALSPMRGRKLSEKSKLLMSKIHSERDRTNQWKNKRKVAPKVIIKNESSLSRPGSLNGFAKLDEEKVIKIRDLYSTGQHSMFALSKKFGVDKKTILNVIHRNFWKHV